MPQPAPGEDGSSKHLDASVPKVSMEGTSKRLHASEFRKQLSAKTSGRVRRLSSVQVCVCLVVESETLCPCVYSTSC